MSLATTEGRRIRLISFRPTARTTIASDVSDEISMPMSPETTATIR